ncbi:hypothetical protein GCM10028807_27760 [Spirosoma daeguense]
MTVNQMEFTGERYIPEMSGEIAYEHMNRYYFVINQLDITNKVVLDIASGEGYGTRLLSDHAEHVYGVDISDDAVSHAKVKYKKNNLTFLVGDAISIPIQSNSIDVVVSFETIEHIDKHQSMIDEIKRVLKKDGVLIISSPDKLHYTDLNDSVNHFHVKELYYEEFKSLMNNNFKKSLFFSQKIFAGSVIALDEEHNQYQKPLIIDRTGTKTSFEPKYNIAIGTNGENLSFNYTMVNYTDIERIIIPAELAHAHYEGQLHITKSLSYRIGSIFVKPLRSISRFLKK